MIKGMGLFSVVAIVYLIDSLLTKVQGDDPNSKDEPVEVKYAIIGVGIGVFFSLCFVAIKFYMLKKHMLDNELSDADSDKRPSFMSGTQLRKAASQDCARSK
ncbi:transmembrane protein 273-like isoform X2 [Scleropages formosus]|uniref:transmembrane protein 273-like isoform X2 n=1 Tax=Scleropages formosus TaxID=113540 RepID=UPI000878E166|nr:transmembrane protein 273 isoform X2 [Scleropages formosus]